MEFVHKSWGFVQREFFLTEESGSLFHLFQAKFKTFLIRTKQFNYNILKYICTFGPHLSPLKAMWTDLQSIQTIELTFKNNYGQPLLRVYISKLNVICDLVSIVPCVQHTLFGIVVNLRGVGVVVGEGHSGNHLSVCVRVEGVFQVGVLLVVAVNSVKDAAHDEAVPVVVSP